jgi:methyl-accepting chemotaxis protein
VNDLLSIERKSMQRFKDFKIRTKLALMIGLTSAGFAAFGIYAYLTLKQLGINGPIYRNIIAGKELISDILPPPLYIIEAHLTVHQMAIETDSQKASNLADKLIALKLKFQRRYSYWIKTIDGDRTNSSLLLSSYQPAKEYFEIAEREFVPSVIRGDQSKARELINNVLERKYQKHRLAIDELVQSVRQDNEALGKKAHEIVAVRTIALCCLGFVIIIAISIFSFLILTAISDSLSRTAIPKFQAHFMDSLSE